MRPASYLGFNSFLLPSSSHSSFSILYSTRNSSHLWTWHSQLPVSRMLCPRLCEAISFLLLKFYFKRQLSLNSFTLSHFKVSVHLFQIISALHLSTQSLMLLSLLAVPYLSEMPVPGYGMIPGTLKRVEAYFLHELVKCSGQ